MRKEQKQSNRDSVTGEKLPPGQHVRPARIAVDADGNEHRVVATGGKGYVLPEGMRWARRA